MKRFRTLVMAGVLVAGAGLVGMSPGAANGWYFSITKENTGPASIVAGGAQKAQFTITVTLQAPPPVVQPGEGGPAVRVEDILPDGLVIDTLPAECAADTDISFHCDWEAPDFSSQSKSFVMTASAPAWLPAGTYTNCAFLSENAPPVDQELPSNCQIGAPPMEPIPPTEAGATVEVTNDADMQLTASDPGQTDPGKTVQLTWTAVNAGPSVASAPLTLTATLPDGVTFVSAASGPWQCTVAGSQVTCTYVPTQTAPQLACGPVDGPQSTCEPVIFPSETIPPVTWNVSIANPSKVGSYSVQAKVTSPTPDSKPANSASTGAIAVTPVDLAVVKSAGSPVLVGDDVQYTLDVSNVGTIADLGKVTVVDTLPTGAVFKSATGEGWSCVADGLKVTCTDTHAEFAAGASERILVDVQFTAAGSPENKVEVSTTAFEKNLANNSASKVVRVNRAPQTAAQLPASPRRILSAKTDQGQRLTTRVRCIPVKASAAGEVSYCKVIRANGVVKVKVFGSQKMKVKVVQTAKGTEKFKPFMQRKTYIVKP